MFQRGLDAGYASRLAAIPRSEPYQAFLCLKELLSEKRRYIFIINLLVGIYGCINEVDDLFAFAAC